MKYGSCALRAAPPLGTAAVLAAALTARAQWEVLPLEEIVSFTPQLAVLGALLLLLAAARRQWLWCTANLAGTAACITVLLPSLPFIPVGLPIESTSPHRLDQEQTVAARGVPEPPSSGLEVKLMHANTLYGNPHGDRIVELIQKERPVAVFLVELDDELHRAIDPLKEAYPYRVPCDGDLPKHIQLLSSVPFTNDSVRYFLDPLRPIVDASIEVEHHPLRIIAAHVVAPVSFTKFDLRNRQLEAVAAYLQTIDDPYVLLGDMNTTPWSPAYRQFTGTAGLHSLRDGRGIFPSWFLLDPKFPLWGISIDHAFTHGALEGTGLTLGPDVGSDHLPLIAMVRIP